MGGVDLLAVVQARMSSSRLPQKMLMDLSGRSVLGWVLYRLNCASRVSEIVLATSTDVSDDPLVSRARSLGCNVVRGSLDNVTARVSQVLEKTGASAFVRICGDSPFICPSLIDRAIDEFERKNVDLVTNVFPRSFPTGQSVEVFCAKAFLNVQTLCLTDEDKEHVSSFFYKHSKSFRIYNFQNIRDLSGMRLSLDTMDDYKKMTVLVQKSISIDTDLNGLVSQLENLS